MKIVTKCTGFHNYLVYLKDDNNNSLECYELTGDDADVKRMAKETELMIKYDLKLKDVEFVNLDEFNREKYMESQPYVAPKDYPLILVFYLDRDLMNNKQILIPYAQSVNDGIAARKANIMVYFLPTDGEERIECINPKQVSAADMDKINAMVQEIAEQFNVEGIDLTDEEGDDSDSN